MNTVYKNQFYPFVAILSFYYKGEKIDDTYLKSSKYPRDKGKLRQSLHTYIHSHTYTHTHMRGMRYELNIYKGYNTLKLTQLEHDKYSDITILTKYTHAMRPVSTDYSF